MSTEKNTHDREILVHTEKATKMLVDVVYSNLDAKLLAYVIMNMDEGNKIVKEGTNDPVTTDYLAEKVGVTPRKVRGFLRRCIDHDVLCRNKKILSMNPCIYIPYKERRG